MASLSFLRDADWLDARRVRAYALILGIVSLALLTNSFVNAMKPAGTDFLVFWGAGHVTAAGDPAAAYDLAVQKGVQTGTGATGWFAFVNPPPFLFAVAPFGALPFPLAWIAWVVVTYALWAWASIRAFPRLWLLVLAWPGALIAAGHAQNGLLTGAMLVFAASQLARRPALSGAAIGALVIKPHLALLMPFWLAAGGRWRAFLIAGATALGLMLAAWLVFGTATMLAYTTSWDASAALMRPDNPDFFVKMTTFYAQARMFFDHPLPLLVGTVSALMMAVVALLAWRRFDGDVRASAAAVLAATALAPPYLFNYDLPFLIFPTLWLVEQGLTRGFRPYERLALVALYVAPYATRAAALPLAINLMPLAALALLALVWSRPGSGLVND